MEETLKVTIEAGEAGKWKLAVRKLKQLSKVRTLPRRRWEVLEGLSEVAVASWRS